MEQGEDCVVLDWGVNLMSNQLGILNKIFHFKILLWSGLPIGQDSSETNIYPFATH